MREQIRKSKAEKVEVERKQLQEKVTEHEVQIKEIQDRLKALNESDYEIASPPRREVSEGGSEKENYSRKNSHASEMETEENGEDNTHDAEKGAPGPDGEFVEFPEYDGTEAPKECKKAFTHFCLHTRKEVKASLDPSERKNKVRSRRFFFVEM